MRQGVGILGVSAGGDPAGIPLEDDARTFALEVHGFEGVPPEVDAHNGARCFWHTRPDQAKSVTARVESATNRIYTAPAASKTR